MNSDDIDLAPIGADDWVLWRKLRLEALREAPYAFSSRLADWQGEGDTEPRWRARLSAVPCNIVSYLRRMPAGMASATAPEDRSIELISMWVAPFARGRGVGDALIGAIISWATEQAAVHIHLAVFESNPRAIALYRRHGFVDAGVLKPGDPGLPVERRMIRDL
jgi:ribosomal protein S18 acetylase RimI-like enzyme